MADTDNTAIEIIPVRKSIDLATVVGVHVIVASRKHAGAVQVISRRLHHRFVDPAVGSRKAVPLVLEHRCVWGHAAVHTRDEGTASHVKPVTKSKPL